jgi:hypothetical protein
VLIGYARTATLEQEAGPGADGSRVPDAVQEQTSAADLPIFPARNHVERTPS